MGKKVKQFIDKKNASVFSIVHRSQRDPLYHQENASRMVLIPVKQGNSKSVNNLDLIPKETLFQATRDIDYDAYGSDEEYDEDLETVGEGESKEEGERQTVGLRLLGDKVDAEGLPIDGYDYSQHLREIGADGMLLDAHGRMIRMDEDVMVRYFFVPSPTKS